jgi:hypothetical protein
LKLSFRHCDSFFISDSLLFQRYIRAKARKIKMILSFWQDWSSSYWALGLWVCQQPGSVSQLLLQSKEESLEEMSQASLPSLSSLASCLSSCSLFWWILSPLSIFLHTFCSILTVSLFFSSIGGLNYSVWNRSLENEVFFLCMNSLPYLLKYIANTGRKSWVLHRDSNLRKKVVWVTFLGNYEILIFYSDLTILFPLFFSLIKILAK